MGVVSGCRALGFSADTRGAESDSESAVGKVWPGPVCRCEAETVPVP